MAIDEDPQLAGDTFSLTMAETNLGGLLSLQGKFEEAEGLIEQALRRSSQPSWPSSIRTAWDEGATLSLDNATDLAIRVCQSI